MAQIFYTENPPKLIIRFEATDLNPFGSIVLKYVPPGRFEIYDGEDNVSVITKGYWMSQHQITREQFSDIMGTDPSTAPYEGDRNKNPVNNVNWYHVIAFCNKLSNAEGLEPVYSVFVSGEPVDWDDLTYANIPTANNSDWNAVTCDWNANGYRLPTVMEWVWAAMGAPESGQNGNTDTTNYGRYVAGYTGSGDINDYYWYSVNSDGKTHEVGKKFPNKLDLYDMSGNVKEWCWDWWIDPGEMRTPDPDYRGPSSSYGDVKTLQGGSFDTGSGSDEFEVSASLSHQPIYSQWYNNGFRVVRN